MTVISELDDNWSEKAQREAVVSVRAALENATNTLTEAMGQVQAAKDNGHYDLIAPQLKAQFDIWGGQFETSLNVIANNPNIQDILNWRP